MLTLGIDPGVTGALAVYDGHHVRIFDMPCLRIKKGTSEKRRVHRSALFDLVAGIADASPDLAVVEDVGGAMGQSASASCTFGKSAGYAEMAVEGNRIPIELVPPATWKAYFRLKGGKDAARALASSLIPSGRHYFARAMDDGRAESALLALYAYRLLVARAAGVHRATN
jgi:Holliday junction resolvasome RuvABC endonuclease subunit